MNSMSSPLAELLRAGLSFSEDCSVPRMVASSPNEDGLYDSLDGSSTELTDVFEEDFFEGEPWSPPEAELCRRVCIQLERYFSDESLAEDAFLLKHVQKNRMGYVSLKLLTSFKKVRELTRDWRTTLVAARSSSLLQVNEEGTKVRRREPLPEWLLCVPTSKLLLAWNLLGDPGAEERATLGLEPLESQALMEKAMRLFGSYGAIASLRVLRPGKELPAELRRYAKRHGELGRRVCAVIEFEYLEGARRAYEALRGAVAERGVRVALLGSRGSRKLSLSQDECRNLAEDGEGDGERGAPRRSARKAKHPLFSLEDSALCSSSESDFTPASPKPVRRVTRPQSLYGSPLAIPHPSSFYGDPFSNPLASPLGSPLMPRRLFVGGTPSPLAAPELCSSLGPSGRGSSCCEGECSQDGRGSGSPWVQRRQSAAHGSYLESVAPAGAVSPRKPCVAVKVLRQPLGPDGSRGFYNCLGRGKLQLRQ
ncbi:la-related protein 6b isoform X2 [Scleropages formosus]|uniref:la-related protein 6b isoform X2 n=1 Tax=Scleropages formosus TaxID=113540 RepID=UPI0010FAA71C|nr:la-related protein 6-like isoform X2 [Scleropages formosus]